jgi:zinc protease
LVIKISNSFNICNGYNRSEVIPAAFYSTFKIKIDEFRRFKYREFDWSTITGLAENLHDLKIIVMKKYIMFLLFCPFTIISSAQKKFTEIDIPFKKFVLNNGLTLIVSEDHKMPMAAIEIWYHVGSKNEKPGKTGFAHLFEHIMFTGSQHYPDFDKVMQTVGGVSNNGTTSYDRTNFYENFTSAGLDRVLWAESDRMGFLLNGLDSTKVEVQRGVVKNEKRQADDWPYSIVDELTIKGTYPAAHPYSWSVIGSMRDLDAASITDVKEWFKSYYGPNNAFIAIVGDVSAEDVLNKVKKYFGDLPAGPPIIKHSVWIAKMHGTHEQIAEDRVPQPRLEKVWNTPEWGSREITYLDLLSNILTNGASSRLYKRLVLDEALCTDVWSYDNGNEIGQQFIIGANIKPSIDVKKVNGIINEELNKIFTKGITKTELELAKTSYFSSFIKGIEQIGGYKSKSDILVESETYGGSPDYYKKIQTWKINATTTDIQKTARDWLSDGEYTLYILPYPEYKNTLPGFDRTIMPPVGKPPLASFPKIKQFQLSSGLKVYLAERHGVPIINLSCLFSTGTEADQLSQPGVSWLTNYLLNEGTTTKSTAQISDMTNALGAGISAFSGLGYTTIEMSALKSNLDSSLSLMTDLILHPTFPEKNFERAKKEQIVIIQQEETNPLSIGWRILPKLLFGKDHPYSNPASGTGYKETVSKITRNDLIHFHNTWFSINNAIMVIAGDISEAEIKPILEKYLMGWKSVELPKIKISEVSPVSTPAVYLVDVPGAEQTVINAAFLCPAPNSKDRDAIEMVNTLLAGSFLSRINMNLREDKHWVYHVRSQFFDSKMQGMYVVYAPVQTDKTKESTVEMIKEFNQLNGEKLISEEEFRREQTATLLEISGNWETDRSIRAFLQNTLLYNRGLDYPDQYSTIIQNLTLNDVRVAAASLIKTQNLTWLYIGDRSKIEAGIRELNLGTMIILDKEGNEIK